MDITTIDILCHIIIPIVVGLVVYIVCGNSTQKALEAYDNMKEHADHLEEMCESIVRYFDREAPTYDSIDPDALGYIADHPSSFCMDEYSKELIRNTCENEHEVNCVMDNIRWNEENLVSDYFVRTSHGYFKVHCGIAVSIDEKENRLSFNTISDMTSLNGGKDTFLIMATIMQNERKNINKYTIHLSNYDILVDGEEFTLDPKK